MQDDMMTPIGRIEQGEDGEYYLISNVIVQMGWDEYTLIEWIDNDDGTHRLKVIGVCGA